MTAIAIILIIAALVLFFLASKRREEARKMAKYADDRIAQADKMQADAREAMRRNGKARLELDKREGDFDLHHKVVETSYVESDDDRTKYPSDEKRLAVIKSRLAHNIGYRFLAAFPEPDVKEDESGAKVYGYRLLVRKEK